MTIAHPLPSPQEIDALLPQERRYDVPIEDDFVVSVLPNGIKTWVFVYAQDGLAQRRTLGVYPDMGLDAARASLAAARATRLSLREASERSARAAAARAPSRAAPHPRRRRRGLGAIVLAAAAAGAAALYLTVRLDPGEGANTTPATAPEGVAQIEAQPPPSGIPAAPPKAEPVTAAPETAPVPPAALAQETPPAPAPAPASPPTPIPGAANDTTPSDSAAPLDAPVVTLRDSRVARAQLASKVASLEPVDSIGPVIVGVPGGVEKVYFYTDLRGLGGSKLKYRWEHEGRVEAEVPLTVGAGARWRTYSQKDVRSDKTGQWRVQLLDDADTVLAEAQFIYRNDASSAQSIEAD